MKKAIVERNPSVDLLVSEALKHKDEVGWVFTFAHMAKTAGGNVDFTSPRGRSYVTTWRKIMRCQHRMEFSSVRGEGYKLADDSGKVDAVHDKVSRIRRHARQAAQIHATGINPEKLSEDKRGLMEVDGLKISLLLRVVGTKTTQSLGAFKAKTSDLKRLGITG